jgi:hypothetical protein
MTNACTSNSCLLDRQAHLISKSDIIDYLRKKWVFGGTFVNTEFHFFFYLGLANTLLKADDI